MEVNCETIKHLASLSDFAISEEQTETLTKNLQDIIKYISQLDELDTDKVEPTYQVFEMDNVWRDDEIIPQDAEKEMLLKLTKNEANHQIKVPKVL